MGGGEKKAGIISLPTDLRRADGTWREEAWTTLFTVAPYKLLARLYNRTVPYVQDVQIKKMIFSFISL